MLLKDTEKNIFSSERRIPRRYLIPTGLIVVVVPTHDNSRILDELSMKGWKTRMKAIVLQSSSQILVLLFVFCRLD